MTPTQYLVMEVLAARWRLGFDYWTFPGDHPAYLKAIRALSLLGYIGYEHRDCNGNWLVGLSEQGIKAWKLDERMTYAYRNRAPQ